MKSFQIWSEGYSCTKNSSKAQYHATIKAYSFKEACQRHAKKNMIFNSYFDSDTMTYWGCRLFDNEEDASKSFG